MYVTTLLLAPTARHILRQAVPVAPEHPRRKTKLIQPEEKRWPALLRELLPTLQFSKTKCCRGGGALRPLAGPRRRGSPEEALGGARELDANRMNGSRSNPAFGYYRFGTLWGFVMPGGFLGGEFSFSGYIFCSGPNRITVTEEPVHVPQGSPSGFSHSGIRGSRRGG